MKKAWFLAAVLCLLLAGCGQQVQQEISEGETAYAELLATTPVAELEGEALSPDGRFEVRTVGKSAHYVSGVVTPERLQIVDTKTGDVLWEDMGYLWQSALWSPDSSYVALAYSGRTWTDVKIFETDTWTSWDFTLPDGSSIPEYTFLPEDWGAWEDTVIDENNLRITVGRGGDAGEQRIYRCFLRMEDEQLAGSTLEESGVVLPGDYDFDHDDVAETLELVTVLDPEYGEGQPAWYELRVKTADGGELWSESAHWAHPGWTSIFACEVEGQDYLLRYLPTVYQGFATYRYEVFSLDAAGQEALLQGGGVDFDIDFGSPFHHSFVPSAIAAFLEEVHSYLDDSTLLMTTEGGEFRTGGSGASFREDADFWDEYCPYDETKSLEENLRNYEAFSEKIRGIE